MDAVDFLTHQHRSLEALLKQAVKEQDHEERKRLFEQAADHLTTHIASEEEVFYPAVKAKKTEDILLESLEEHLSLKRLLSDLLELDLSRQTFEPKLKVLREQAEHHHKEEEENLFPKVRKLLSGEELEALARDMAALQLKLTQQGEPREAVKNETDAAAAL